ncbi:MAG: YicC family protein [Muribaculaceae bacterium]|nr:YicC family protein [Muribaculaceae bacterium]
MLLSMTGFGKSIVELPDKKIIVEIKSLNSKQLDLAMRLPSIMRENEMEMRALVAKLLVRGKVELTMYIENMQSETNTQLNITQMAAYKRQYEEMQRQLGLPAPADWYTLLLRFPDSVKSDNGQVANERDFNAALQAIEEAAAALTKHRATEGERLTDFFTLRVDAISTLLAEVPKYEVERVAHIRSRIIDNLGKLPQVEYDRNRLEQEMIFYIEKLDINEEKQRLAQHISYFKETMAGDAGQGKKLGFISQEMGREINTLGSKSNHAEMQRLVVKMKDELEQIKEQVLNVM